MDQTVIFLKQAVRSTLLSGENTVDTTDDLNCILYLNFPESISVTWRNEKMIGILITLRFGNIESCANLISVENTR